MNSRSPLLYGLVAVIAAAAGYFVGRQPSTSPAVAGSTDQRTIRFYQSPMHPWITSAKPGRCTICGMNLVAVYEGDAGFGTGDTITLSDATAAVIGVATSPATETDLTRILRVNGVLDDNATRHRVLTARTPGRIEKLFIDQVGMPVAAGAPLLTLFSPTLQTAQRVYLERFLSGPGAISASDLAAARERLLDLGALPDDITELERTRKPNAILTVRAPFAGTVVARGPNAYEGSYVDEAATLFEIGDLSELWFVFDAYESDLGQLRLGQSVALTPAGWSDAPIVAQIDFIDPNLDPTTRTARVRVVVPNPAARLRHRQTAVGEVTLNSGRALTVPRSAVLFTRAEPTVFVSLPENAYRPVAVTVGRSGEGVFEITAGLNPGDIVVTRAALLLEGQAQLSGLKAAHPSIPMASAEPMAMPAHDPAADIAALKPIVFATADAAAALAADDLASYATTLPRIQSAWTAYVAATPDAAQGPLADLVAALVPGPDLEAARTAYEPFSTQIADLTRHAGLHHDGSLTIFQCPMSPVLGTGRWVQRSADLKNPFFGSDMLTCGSKID